MRKIKDVEITTEQLEKNQHMHTHKHMKIRPH